MELSVSSLKEVCPHEIKMFNAGAGRGLFFNKHMKTFQLLSEEENDKKILSHYHCEGGRERKCGKAGSKIRTQWERLDLV
jgi:hypothetical protein